MGFLDKMKSMKNAVTGGGAKVFIICDNFSQEEPFEITVRAEIKDANIKISKVYLDVVGSEVISIRDSEGVYNSNSDTVSTRFNIADAEVLNANEVYEWKAMIELPQDSPAIYYGNDCSHTYKAKAGLDAPGNDPDSGWIQLHR